MAVTSGHKQDEHNNKLVVDNCNYVKVLAAKLHYELQKVTVVGFVMTVQYDNIINVTIGCVVFTIMSLHKSHMTLMTNWDLVKLKHFLLN